MKTIKYKELTDDDLLKIQKVEKYTKENKGKWKECPYCGLPAIKIYPDTKGHIQDKCDKCRKEVSFVVYRYSHLSLLPKLNSYNYINY